MQMYYQYMRAVAARVAMSVRMRGDHSPRRVYRLLTMSVLVVGVMCAGCGVSTAQGTPATGAVGATSGGHFLTDQNPTIDVTTAGLHIHGGIVCDREFMLATSRLSYDTAEIQAMKAFINQKYSGPGKIPSTLEWVNTGEQCGGDLQITNTGSTTVEVVRVGVKALAAPLKNTYQYRFVDICPMQTIYTMCPPHIGGGPHCGTFTAGVRLAAGIAGKTLESALDPGSDEYGPCPAERPLRHGDSIEVYLAFTSNGPNANLVYSVAPALTIKTGNSQQVVTITQAKSTLVFASSSQYSCYALHGTTFKVAVRGAHAIGFGSTYWCQ